MYLNRNLCIRSYIQGVRNGGGDADLPDMLDSSVFSKNDRFHAIHASRDTVLRQNPFLLHNPICVNQYVIEILCRTTRG